jgi:hypothetical protein
VSLVAPGRGQVALVARFWAVGRSRAGAAIGIPARRACISLPSACRHREVVEVGPHPLAE